MSNDTKVELISVRTDTLNIITFYTNGSYRGTDWPNKDADSEWKFDDSGILLYRHRSGVMNDGKFRPWKTNLAAVKAALLAAITENNLLGEAEDTHETYSGRVDISSRTEE